MTRNTLPPVSHSAPPPAETVSPTAASRATGEIPAVTVPSFYITGGSLPEDACSYVERQADHDLLNALCQGQFCYVLDSRQVGKSSLMVRTAAKLRAQNRRVVVLDLSAFGQNVSPEQWYFGMLFAIGDQLHLEEELETFWGEHARLGLIQRWTEAVGQAVLMQFSEPLVIFIDEIDAVKSLPFSVDEFFAAIRECYNRRTQDSAFTRLTFCLIGVATPSELIRNPHTTPFNIGQRIALRDFSAAEATPLALGLSTQPGEGAALLRRILYWTSGHPYLTQILCRYMAERGNLRISSDVDQACHSLFLTRQARETNDNLTFVRKRLLGDCASDAQIAEMLKCYSRILRGREKVPDDPTNPLVTTLLLCGIVQMKTVGMEGVLRVRNRIYAQVFNHRWVCDTMPNAELRRLRAAIRRDVARASVSWLVAVMGLVLASWQFTVAHNAAQQAEQSRILMKAQRTQIAAHQRDIQNLRQKQNEIQQIALRAESRRQQAEARRQQAQVRQQQAEEGTQQALRLMSEARVATNRAQAQQKTTLRAVILAKAEARHAGQRFATMQQQSATLTIDILAQSATQHSRHSGEEIEALRSGLRAVAVSTRLTHTPSAAALQGLVNAVSVGKFRLLRLQQEGSVICARFSPDDERILTAGTDRYAYLWDAHTGKLLQKLLAQDTTPDRQANAKLFNINSAEFSPDGTRILTAGDDKQIRLWDATDRRFLLEKPLLTQKQEYTTQFNASFSHNGKYLVISGPGYDASIWDIQTHKVVRTLHDNSHTAYIWSVAFSEDDRQVVTAGQDGAVKVWDTDTGKQRADFRRHHGPVLSAIFNRWGNVIISAGEDKTVQSWNWRDPNTYERYRDYVGHRDWVWSVARSRTGDVNYLATCGRDGNVLIWNFDRDIAPLYTIDTHAGSVYDAQFSQDNTRLVTASSDHTSEVWYFPIPILLGLGNDVTNVEFSPDGMRTLVASTDGHVYLGNIKAGSGQLRFDWDGQPISYASFSPDGKRVAAAGTNNTPRIWTPQATVSEQKGYFRDLQGHTSQVYCIKFSPDGTQVITASGDGTTRVWDAQTEKCLHVLRGHASAVVHAVLSRDNKMALTAGKDGTARLWDVQTEAVLRTFAPARPTDVSSMSVPSYPNMAVFSPDEQHILTADANHQAYLWNVKTGKQEAVLGGHAGSVQSACFSADGTRIVTASLDQTARIWDLKAALRESKQKRTATPLFTINVNGKGVTCARFSPNNQQILVGCIDGTVKLYPATLRAFIYKANEILRQVPAHSALKEFTH